MNMFSIQLIFLSQWENYIEGWQLLIESGDLIFWTILIFIAWIVRALSLIVLLIQFGDKIIRNKKDIDLNIITTGIIFFLVTVPFFLAGLPLLYPIIP